VRGSFGAAFAKSLWPLLRVLTTLYRLDTCADFDAQYIKGRRSAQECAFWGSWKQWYVLTSSPPKKRRFCGHFWQDLANFSLNVGLNIAASERESHLFVKLRFWKLNVEQATRHLWIQICGWFLDRKWISLWHCACPDVNKRIRAKKPRYINSNISEAINPMNTKLERQVKTTKDTSWVVYHVLYHIQDGGRPPFWKCIWRHYLARGGLIWNEIWYTDAAWHPNVE